MDWNILIEIVIGAGAVISGVFALIKYMITQNTKREGAILQHNEKQQTQMMEFYEKKNGHLERISNKFTDSNNSMIKAVGNLTTEIKVLADRHR